MMRTYPLVLLVFSLVISLAGCSLLPAPEAAPRQLQLTSLTTTPGDSQIEHSSPFNLVIERPRASLPLQQRELWYSQQPFYLQPYSRYLWAESLDRQLQRLVSEFLAAQPWTTSVALDSPGIRSDLRLALTLHHWYLDVPRQKLMIGLQMNLLDHQGHSLLQRNWQGEEAVNPVSPPGLAAASQRWLQAWADELAGLLFQLQQDGMQLKEE